MSSPYLTNGFWNELNASQFALLKKLFSCWFEIIVVMCIKLVELCCTNLPVHYRNTLNRLLLAFYCAATIRRPMMKAWSRRFGHLWFSRVRPLDGPNSVIKSSNTYDRPRGHRLRGENYGAWKNAQVSHVESKCNEMNSYKHCSF